MSKMFREYEGGLTPRYRFLSDKAVIVQAWKKAHEYIRRHNWYSDNLDLDLSCINLEDLYLEIQKDFMGRGGSRYRPSSMRVVPAPKACSEWNLSEGDFQSPPNFGLRPLAHLKVKDQVVSMMFLMCLANVIERRQGVPRPVGELDRLMDVVSYGNRLITDLRVKADVEDDQEERPMGDASFLWGNSETYSRYYEDYQNFIARPGRVLKGLQKGRASEGRHYYIVSLDLSKFYDRVDRKVLVEKVRREVTAANLYDKAFVDALARAMEWRWDDRDARRVARYQTELNDGDSGGWDWAEGRAGIPQGLATGGFFANIYLLAFDDYMKLIVSDGKSVETSGVRIRIHDYCRYVDDMRLVVSVGAGEEIGADERLSFVNYLQEALASNCPGQRFSPEKISWEEVLRGTRSDFTSIRIAESKHMASGTMDERSACELIELNRSLWADAAEADGEDSGRTKNPFYGRFQLPCRRSGIRPDRVERFAANNWRRAYRALVGMLPDEPEGSAVPEGGTMPLGMLNALTDQFCEEIIKRWTMDPSKVRILRIALDLRPLKRYLEFVLDVLWGLLHADERSRACGTYVLAELYRAAAVETGFSYANADLKYKKDWGAYRKTLHEQAARFLALGIPWFAANQIMLYELTYNKGASIAAGEIMKSCDQIYRDCHSLITRTTGADYALSLPVSTVILSYQLSGDEKIIDRYRLAFLKAGRENGSDARKCMAFLPSFASEGTDSIRYVLHDKDAVFIERCKDSVEWKPLRKLAFSDDNPFLNEVAAIRLGLALWEFVSKKRVSTDKYFTLRSLEVACADWGSLSRAQSTTCELKVREVCDGESDVNEAFMFMPEPWESRDFSRMAQVGRILRAVVMSGDEYSLMRRKPLTVQRPGKSDESQRFFGVRSMWLKRRYGLYFDRVCLGGVHVAFSPWFSELLSALLAWPGSFVVSKYRQLTFNGLLDALRDRLADLGQFECVEPETLLIPVDVDLGKFSKNKNQKRVNVAVVQTLHPDEKCLKSARSRSSLKSRRKARRHLSDILSMLENTFETHKALTQVKKSINLVVFPELSVYPQDIGFLKRFADRRNCMIFCGLVYCLDPNDDKKIVNTGLWIIPQRRDSQNRRVFIELLQGKAYPAHVETDPRLHGWRPVQWVVRGVRYKRSRARKVWAMSASICYDATDIRLAAALRDHVDCYVVSAFNPDVGLFDAMAESWRYHMYGHTILANTGVYGGSTVQAPYKAHHKRIIAHTHGSDQVQILLARIDLHRFESTKYNPQKVKTPPAGYAGRKR